MKQNSIVVGGLTVGDLTARKLTPLNRFAADPKVLVGRKLDVVPEVGADSLIETVTRVTPTRVYTVDSSYQISNGFEVVGRGHASVIDEKEVNRG